MKEYTFEVNGLSVNAKYSEQNIEEIFLPLLKKLTALQKEKNRRLLVFLSAPPAVGKSTLAHFLQELSEQRQDLTNIQAIGMDGFHHYNEWLLSHMTERNGQEISMIAIKGAPETFDLDLFKAAIQNVMTKQDPDWPLYDRANHQPKEHAIQIESDILLLEGNYLLLDRDGWRDLKQYADYTIKISASPELLRERLIARKQFSIPDRKQAEAFVDFSDMVNVRLCLEHSLPADTELILRKDNTYGI